MGLNQFLLSGSNKPKSLSVQTAPDTQPKKISEVSWYLIDPAIIADLVNKHRASGDVINRLLSKLTEGLRYVVEDAIKIALGEVNKEVARLCAGVKRLSAMVSELDNKSVEITDDLKQYQ